MGAQGFAQTGGGAQQASCSARRLACGGGSALSCVSQTHVHAFRLLGDQPYCDPRCSEPGGLASAALKADEPLPLPRDTMFVIGNVSLQSGCLKHAHVCGECVLL